MTVVALRPTDDPYWPDDEPLKRAAVVRARRLANELLTPAQRASWRKHDRFEVKGSQGGCYWIYNQPFENILDAQGRGWCVWIADSFDRQTIPGWDQLVAQKMLIEHNEGLFKAISHRVTLDDMVEAMRKHSACLRGVPCRPRVPR